MDQCDPFGILQQPSIYFSISLPFKSLNQRMNNYCIYQPGRDREREFFYFIVLIKIISEKRSITRYTSITLKKRKRLNLNNHFRQYIINGGIFFINVTELLQLLDE